MKNKTCTLCLKIKPLNAFHKKASSSDGHRSKCKECRISERKEHYVKNKEKVKETQKLYFQTEKGKYAHKKANNKYHNKNRDAINKKSKENKKAFPWKPLLHGAKHRAKKLGLPFNLTEEDVVIPDICPALGIKLEIGNGRMQQNSPTLDRIIPENGYVKGNVIVVSLKANAMKNNATIDEMRKVVDFYESII